MQKSESGLNRKRREEGDLCRSGVVGGCSILDVWCLCRWGEGYL